MHLLPSIFEVIKLKLLNTEVFGKRPNKCIVWRWSSSKELKRWTYKKRRCELSSKTLLVLATSLIWRIFLFWWLRVRLYAFAWRLYAKWEWIVVRRTFRNLTGYVYFLVLVSAVDISFFWLVNTKFMCYELPSVVENIVMWQEPFNIFTRLRQVSLGICNLELQYSPL